MIRASLLISIFRCASARPGGVLQPTEAEQTVQQFDITACKCNGDLGRSKYKYGNTCRSSRSFHTRKIQAGLWCYVPKDSACTDKTRGSSGKYYSYLSCCAQSECRYAGKYGKNDVCPKNTETVLAEHYEAFKKALKGLGHNAAAGDPDWIKKAYDHFLKEDPKAFLNYATRSGSKLAYSPPPHTRDANGCSKFDVKTRHDRHDEFASWIGACPAPKAKQAWPSLTFHGSFDTEQTFTTNLPAQVTATAHLATATSHVAPSRRARSHRAPSHRRVRAGLRHSERSAESVATARKDS